MRGATVTKTDSNEQPTVTLTHNVHRYRDAIFIYILGYKTDPVSWVARSLYFV